MSNSTREGWLKHGQNSILRVCFYHQTLFTINPQLLALRVLISYLEQFIDYQIHKQS